MKMVVPILLSRLKKTDATQRFRIADENSAAFAEVAPSTAQAEIVVFITASDATGHDVVDLAGAGEKP